MVEEGMKKNVWLAKWRHRWLSGGFPGCFGAVLPALPKRRGCRPRVPLAEVLPALFSIL